VRPLKWVLKFGKTPVKGHIFGALGPGFLAGWTISHPYYGDFWGDPFFPKGVPLKFWGAALGGSLKKKTAAYQKWGHHQGVGSPHIKSYPLIYLWENP